MKEFLIWISYAIVAGALFLALFFLKTQSGSVIRRMMALLAASTGMWVLATTLGAYNANGDITNITSRWTYVFGLLMVTSLFLFSSQFPVASFRLDRWHLVFIGAATAAFSIFILSSSDIIASYSASPAEQGTWHGGSLYWLYNVYLFLFYFGSLIILLAKTNRTDGILRRNLQLVTTSIFLGGMPGVVNDLLLPLFTNTARTPLIGTISTILWLGMTSYILVKK